MRVLFVAQRYHPFQGGVETQTRLVVNELAKHHDVEVVGTKFKENDFRVPSRLHALTENVLLPDYDDYQDGRVQVHALTPTFWDRVRMAPIAARVLPGVTRYLHASLNRFGYWWFRRVYVPKLKALMKDVDVVHSVSGGYLGWAAQEAAHEMGLPFVCVPYVHPGQHGEDADSVAYYSRSDVVLALLETDREYLVELGVPRERIRLYGVVPLLKDDPTPEHFRKKRGLGTAPIILFAGRMVEYKGVFALAHAAERIWTQFPDAQFVFLGPVSESVRDDLCRIDDRIHVLGFVSAEEKASAFAAADVFCMPSRFEILPAVYLEAWSCETPVVGGPAHGLEDLIEGNGAGLVADQTPEDVADALLTLLSDSKAAEEMGRRGAEMVRNRYSVEALVQILERVYSSCIEHRTSDEAWRPKSRDVAAAAV